MKRNAMIHSKLMIQEVEIIKYEDVNNIIVRLEDGTVCTAVDNPFTGLIYADDVYGKLN